MNSNIFFQSKAFKIAVAVIGLLVVVFVSFGVGVLVGYNKAQFSCSWGDNYRHNFGGNRLMPEFFGTAGPAGAPGTPPNPGFISGHGAFGSILDVTSSSIAVSGEDGVERTANISSSTILREDGGSIEIDDLRVGDHIVVIGSPDSQGQINATFVRVLR
jgi:hypothetical protein